MQSKSTGKHGAQFMAARDSRNRRVFGICVRNGRFCGQLWRGGKPIFSPSIEILLARLTPIVE